MDNIENVEYNKEMFENLENVLNEPTFIILDDLIKIVLSNCAILIAIKNTYFFLKIEISYTFNIWLDKCPNPCRNPCRNV